MSQQGSVTGMVPGGAVQDVDFTLLNAAATPQHVTMVAMAISGITWTSAAGAGTGSTLADHPANDVPAGCTSADFTLVQPIADVDVPATDLAFTQATSPFKGGRISMDNLSRVGLLNTSVNQDGCKGASLRLAYTASGKLE